MPQATQPTDWSTASGAAPANFIGTIHPSGIGSNTWLLCGSLPQH
jgi:hypothetical protein